METRRELFGTETGASQRVTSCFGAYPLIGKAKMRKIRFRWTIVVASFLVSSLSNLNVARGDFNYPDFNSIDGLVFNGAAGQLGDRLRLTCSGGETPAGLVSPTL